MEHSMRLRLAALVGAAGLMISACAPGWFAAPGKTAQSDRPRLAAPNIPATDLSRLAADNNAFAVDFFQALRPQDGNLIYSPYSISLALAMTYAGARGDTAQQMAESLHFSLPPDRLHPAFNRLDLDLLSRAAAPTKDVRPLQLEIANAVWAEQDYQFRQEFLDLLATNYGAGIRLADFIKAPEAARVQINDWVSGKTNQRIDDLIPLGAIDEATRMVLVNAIYFKADWLTPFEASATRDAPFVLRDGTPVQVPTMFGELGLPYARADGYQIVELPYQGGTAALDILLPDEGRYDEIEAALDAALLDSALAQMQPVSIQFSLPKFKFSSEFSLKENLSALGMPDAFDPDRADFSGMDGNRDLYIGAVLHKAYVGVDEQGTEAAAATGVIMRATGARLADVVLQVDRPFIFVIRDLPSGQILFIGRVLNPME